MKLVKSKRFKYIFSGIVLLMSIPYFAMQFTNEVQWNVNDFILVFILLLGLGIIIELIFQKSKDIITKRILIFLVICVFLLIWVEISTGILGTPFAGN